MKKILTISVAAYNSEKWIDKCLNSFIVPEIIKDIEVLVINDGSTDRTRLIVQKYISKYPDTFFLIDKENGGHGSTINTSIKAARGRYFKIVDSDDWVEKEGIIALVNKLKNIEVDAVISPYYIVDETYSSKTLMNSISELDRKYINRIVYIDQLNVKWNLSMHALTFRTEMLQSNFTKIDEKCFYVDLEYISFYISYVKTTFIMGKPVYNYLVGTNEQSINMSNMVKRRKEHLHVCRRLLNHYRISDHNTDIIYDIVENCVMNEYRILFEITDYKESKKEIIEFENILKEIGSDIYDLIIVNGLKEKKETAMIVWILRKLHFQGYYIFFYLLHFLM